MHAGISSFLAMIEGNLIKVTTLAPDQPPIVGSVVNVEHNTIVIRTKDERLMMVRMEVIATIEQVPADTATHTLGLR